MNVVLSSLHVAFICLATVAGFQNSAHGEAIKDYVVGAFEAESNQTHEQSYLLFVIGSKSTKYNIRRILPRRLHMIAETDHSRYEIIQVDGRSFFRNSETWEEAPAPDPAVPMPSLTTFLSGQFDDLEEIAPSIEGGIQQRRFRSKLDWQAGAGRNEGMLEIYISSVSNLPTQMKFIGTCSKVSCLFEQSFSYGTADSIVSPLP